MYTVFRSDASRSASPRARALSRAVRVLSVVAVFGVFGAALTGCDGSSKSSTTGATSTTGTTGTTGQSSLIISSASGTTYLKNGGFTGVAAASKTVAAFTLNGVAYDGQYNADIKSDKASIGLDLFGLNVTAGQSFDIATSKRPFINGYDGSDAYLADSGTLTVTAISDTSITFKFTNAHFKAAPESAIPPANQFTLDGSFTAPITAAK